MTKKENDTKNEDNIKYDDNQKWKWPQKLRQCKNKDDPKNKDELNMPSFCSGICDEIHAITKLQNKTLNTL